MEITLSVLLRVALLAVIAGVLVCLVFNIGAKKIQYFFYIKTAAITAMMIMGVLVLFGALRLPGMV